MPVAYKRKASSSAAKRPTKRRRVMRTIPRGVRAPMNLSVKRKFYLENWQPNTTTVNGYWRYYTFNLAQMFDVGQYQAVFDQYRINAIRVEFHPRYSEFAGNDTTDTSLPGITNQSGTRLSVLVDQRSSVVPSGAYSSATYNSFLEQGNARTHQGNQPVVVYFRPSVSQTLGANVAGAARKRAPWMMLDASGQSVNHTGFHILAWDANFSGTFGQSFDVLVTYYLQFKGMR